MTVLRKITSICLSFSRRKFMCNFSYSFRKFSDDPKKHQKTLLSQNTGKFHIFLVDDKGQKSEHFVSKSTLYHNFGLTIRDLRFQHPNMLFVRNKNILMRFQDLKILVCTDGILLIDPPFNEDANQDDRVFQFWQTLPTLVIGSVLYTGNLPLEYKALEAIFMHIMWDFSRSLAKLQPEITDLLSNLTDPDQLIIDRTLVHVLLKYSSRLNSFSTQLNEFCSALQEILDDEEMIRKFCISTRVEGGGRAQMDAYVFSPAEEEYDSEDSAKKFQLHFPGMVQHKYKINLQDEMENLLDTFLRDAEEIRNIVKELKGAIDNSSTAILINLDSYRNSILRFELKLTIGMFSCTVFGLIGMAFGMNLESSLEEYPIVFWSLAALMFGGSGALGLYLLGVSRKPLTQNGDLFKRIMSEDNSGKPPPTGPPNPPYSGKRSIDYSDVLDRKKPFHAFSSLTSSVRSASASTNENHLATCNVLPEYIKRTLLLKKQQRWFNVRRAMDTRQMKSVSDGIRVTELLREQPPNH